MRASRADNDVADTSVASATASSRGGSLQPSDGDEQQQQTSQQQLQRLQQRGSVVSAGDITVDDSVQMGTQNALNTMRRGPSKHYLSGTCVLLLTRQLAHFYYPISHRFFPNHFLVKP